jgi:hypothetical protein
MNEIVYSFNGFEKLQTRYLASIGIVMPRIRAEMFLQLGVSVQHGFVFQVHLDLPLLR